MNFKSENKMIIKAKVKSYTTNKHCCKKHKSLIEIMVIESVFGESYSAECLDCGNIVEGYRNVKNILVTNNPIITPFLLNSANFN
jgi:hypothetical protein